MTALRTLIPWRRRRDVVVRARREDGTGGYVVKDPIASRYYQLGDEEHFLWNQFDGRQTADGLCAAFAQTFPPRQLTAEELQRFVRQLIVQGLVVGEHGHTAAHIEHRAGQQRWQHAVSQFFNVLAIRFRGVNPKRFLAGLLPWCAWMFAPWFLLTALALWLSALGLWWRHAEVFLARWPEEMAQWTVQDVGSLMLVLATVKIIHELAHGLTCKRFGGTVTELGVMLLVFTPCLYCNVSDAWLLRSKWQRIAIGAAGMIAEGILAAAATWLWWASAPGPFHGLCLQVVLICGVSTLVFNLNPLLRYDGYFMLADWLDQPNLHQQAAAALNRRGKALLTGRRVPLPQGWTSGYEWGLALFAMASGMYRMLVLFALMWTLHRWLEPQGFSLVANGIIAVTMIPLLIGIVAAMPPALRTWWQQPPADRSTTGFRAVLIALILLAVFFVPLPCRKTAPVLLEPADAEIIHAPHAGKLTRLAEPGQPTGPEFLTGALFDPHAHREMIRTAGEWKRARARLVAIERRQLIDRQAALQRPAAEQAVHDWERRWNQQRIEYDRLSFRASRNGVFWPATARKEIVSPLQLPTWTGSLDDEQNRDCWVAAGTTVGVVGPADRFEAVAYLSSSQIQDLRVGQSARILLEASPDRIWEGTVTELAVTDTAFLESDLAARLRLPAVVTPQGHRLVGTWYRARIDLSAKDIPPVRRLGGIASIQVAPQSLWQRGRRWFGSTFPQWR